MQKQLGHGSSCTYKITNPCRTMLSQAIRQELMVAYSTWEPSHMKRTSPEPLRPAAENADAMSCYLKPSGRGSSEFPIFTAEGACPDACPIGGFI